MSVKQPAPNCRRCPRLVSLRRRVRRDYPDYHAAPVPGFGAADAALLIVGLAPGMHGANATGRAFTGGNAGDLLFETLYGAGFASAPASRAADDGLELHDCRITNVVKCLPPDNKPVAAEVNACNRFLRSELARPRVVLTLGAMAHKATLKALRLRQADYPFGHAASFTLPSAQTLIASYHCSRYNLNTRRLTPAMFADAVSSARAAVDGDLSTAQSSAS